MKKILLTAAVCMVVLGGSWTAAAGPGGGSSGPKLTTHIATDTDTIGGTGNEFKAAVALCEPGEVVTGGGMEVASINPEVAIVTNAPTEDFDFTGLQGWIVTLAWDEPVFDAEFTAFAICAPGARGRGGR